MFCFSRHLTYDVIFTIVIALFITTSTLRVFQNCLFLSCRVTGLIDDLPSPHHHVHLLARSQPSTFQGSFAPDFPSCLRSSSLPFPWYIRSQHFPRFVFFISAHHSVPTIIVINVVKPLYRGFDNNQLGIVWNQLAICSLCVCLAYLCPY